MALMEATAVQGQVQEQNLIPILKI